MYQCRWLYFSVLAGTLFLVACRSHMIQTGDEVFMMQRNNSPGHTTYYVDAATGDDENAGLSPQKAWQTLDAVNSKTFAPGDKILFKGGTTYTGILRPKGQGSAQAPIVVDVFGSSQRARIDGQGQRLSAVRLHNIEYWEINRLEVTNQALQRSKWLAGVRVTAQDFGAMRHIYLRDLFIHDVNGSVDKTQEGFGIQCHASYAVPSWFEDLRIENCHIKDVARNGIATQSDFTNRKKHWYPSKAVVIRGNTLEHVAGDGIRLWGCEGGLIEHNVVRKSGYFNDLPDVQHEGLEASAGIWPYECDDTIIQFNEVSEFAAQWDGQAFDSDWNCRGTIIQYNYSHDNQGGFLLICTPAPTSDLLDPVIGNQGTIIRYNISQNDGLKFAGENRGYSEVIRFHGPAKDVLFHNNIIYNDTLDQANTWPNLMLFSQWDGDAWPQNVQFTNNIFCSSPFALNYAFAPQASEQIQFSHNLYWGTPPPNIGDPRAICQDPLFKNPGCGKTGLDTLVGYQLSAQSPCIDAGKTLNTEMNLKDFWGQAVPCGASADIGVHEWPQEERTQQ